MLYGKKRVEIKQECQGTEQTDEKNLFSKCRKKDAKIVHDAQKTLSITSCARNGIVFFLVIVRYVFATALMVQRRN